MLTPNCSTLWDKTDWYNTVLFHQQQQQQETFTFLNPMIKLKDVLDGWQHQWASWGKLIAMLAFSVHSTSTKRLSQSTLTCFIDRRFFPRRQSSVVCRHRLHRKHAKQNTVHYWPATKLLTQLLLISNSWCDLLLATRVKRWEGPSVPAGNEETATGMDWTPLFATKKKCKDERFINVKLGVNMKIKPVP